MGELFSSVLGLCAKAGLVKSGVVAIDGTKLHANASRDANVDFGRIAREIIAEGRATDEAEDEQYGDARGDELPGELSTEAGRRQWLARELEQRHNASADENEPADQESGREAGHEFDSEQIVARTQGREGWLREAKRQLDQDRWRAAGPVARSRSERLRHAGQRLEDELALSVAATRPMSSIGRRDG